VDSRKTSKFFSKEDFSSIGDLDIEYTKLNVDKIVDSMTQESFIPTDSVKSDDDHPNFVHNIEIRANTNSDKTNPTNLVR